MAKSANPKLLSVGHPPEKSLSSGHNRGTKKRNRRSKMDEQRLIFTQGWIERLEKSSARQQFYDLKVKGLVLEIMPTGSVIFRFRRKFKNKDQRATIGTYPEISLENARDRATLLAAEMVKGEDFRQQRQAGKEELTLSELASLYFDTYAEGRCATIKKMRQGFDLYWKEEHPLRLSQINTAIVQTRINKLAASGRHRTANWALTQITAMLNWGIRQGLLKSNPAKSVDKFRMRSRERFIQPHEYIPLLKAINGYSDQRLVDFFKLLLYTGARSGNVKTMKWQDINLDLGLWVIPDTKTGSSQTIQLSDAALEILHRRSKTKELNPYVIPGGGKGNPGTQGHLVTPHKAWKTIITAAGPSCADLVIHDLRRSLASFMVLSGAPTPIIMKQLGHKSMAAASVYQRVNNSPVKAATDLAIKTMEESAAASTVRQIELTRNGRKKSTNQKM